MDQDRFDEIARLMAAGAPRRRLLKGLAGSALGALTLGLARRGVGATHTPGHNPGGGGGGQPVCGPNNPCPASSNPCAVNTCVGQGANAQCVLVPGNAGAVCRPAAGLCDVAGVCTGTSAACPADAFKPAGTVCRVGVGGCDPSEACTGTSANCPADVVNPCPGRTVCCRVPASRHAGRCVASQACTAR